MKSLIFSKATLRCSSLLFFLILSNNFISAQSGNQADNQEVQRIRSLTRSLLEILPNESVANASKALTSVEKTNFQSIRKTIATGAQIPDNPTKASLMSYKSQLANSLGSLWSIPADPNGGSNAASKKNNSSATGKSLWDKLVLLNYDPCTRNCLVVNSQSQEDCMENYQYEAAQTECKIRAGERCIACIKACKSETKH